MKIKSVVLAMVAGLVMCATVAMAPQAQAKNEVPQGSYLATCRNANIFQGRDLLALCPNNQGALAVVKLPNYQLCGGDIANVNGQLTCRGGGGGGYRPGPPPGQGGGYYPNQGGGGGYYPPPPPPPNRRNGMYPPGSYLRSCEDVKVVNGWLQASCQDTRGRSRNSQIPLANCRGDIGNMNGQLVCN